MISNKVTDLFILFFLFIGTTCKDELNSSMNFIIASTEKKEYDSGEKFFISITNYFSKEVFIQRCGGSLYHYVERLDSLHSGIPFIVVCRNLTSYGIYANGSYIDTIQVNTGLAGPGNYRVRYFYGFEESLPDAFEEKVYSNEFYVK